MNQEQKLEGLGKFLEEFANYEFVETDLYLIESVAHMLVKYGFHPTYELCEKIDKSTFLIKKPPFHMEGNCLKHTQLALREIMSYPEHDVLDMIIFFYHDLMEHEVMMGKIDTLVKSIENPSDKLIDEVEFYAFDKVISKEDVKPSSIIPKDIIDRIDGINNYGHEDASADYAVESLKRDFYIFDEGILNEVEFCIRFHMQGFFIDKKKNPKEVRNLILSPYFNRLKRVWLADYNGRISDDPKITMSQLEQKILANPMAKKLMK